MVIQMPKPLSLKEFYMMQKTNDSLPANDKSNALKAFTCFKKAAAHDYFEAFVMVENAYLEGQGVENYATGIGTAQDYEKAVEWLFGR